MSMEEKSSIDKILVGGTVIFSGVSDARYQPQIIVEKEGKRYSITPTNDHRLKVAEED